MDGSRHLISLVLLIFVLATFFSSVLSRHRIRHHRDRFKRQQGAHLYLPGSYVLAGGTGPEPEAGPWGDWGPPSACSRSCGGGVSTQVRQCQYEGRCRGPDRKHFSCNTQDCPTNDDYRAEQCAEFDRQPFEGVYYQWIPYTKAPNPCELNCMPRGERFYYRHKKQVADGTKCTADSMDVCVDGQCQPVGCDMMLGSNAREDKCRQCGGNGTTCQTLNGVLDSQDLSAGYNDILLIPAGATNIDVRERSPSNNYLAIRNMTGHYYLNGNWRIDFPKSLRFAGCNFHYERTPQGFPAPDTIICLGPIYEPLFIVLLSQDTNVGVQYEYSIPKAISSDPETYAWIFDDFGACSSSCGGGYQTRRVTCAGRRTLEPVEKSLCDPSTEPPSTQTCAEQACEPQWVPGRWSDCTEACGEDGVQTREIRCERILANGVSTSVNEQYCIQRQLEKPETVQDCNRGTPCPIWFTSPWKPCDRLCGEGKETREVVCYRKVDGKIEILSENYCESKEPKPEAEKVCKIRPCEGVDWVASEWSGCNKCGLDSESRKVHCATQKGEVYSDDLCEGESKPELVRKCEKSKLCETQWYASQWSECSANCGPGIQTRNVFCGTFEGDLLKKLDDDLCDDKNKYDDLMNCTAEVESCEGEWFSGPWSKCDKECGGGTKSRKVICMKEETVIDISNCDANSIPFTNEECNQKPCGEDEVLPVNSTKSVEEPSSEASESTALTTVAVHEPEWDLDDEIEILDDEECLDGEWIDDDEYEDLARLEEATESDEDLSSSSVSTESSSLFSDDGLMMSDSTYSTDETGETSPFTEEGSGESSSPVDTSSPSSDDTSPSDASTESSPSSDLSTVEGSGDSEPTETGPTGETEESEATTIASNDLTTEDSSGATTESGLPTESGGTTVSSDSTDSSDITSDSTDSSGGTTTSDDDTGATTVASSDDTPVTTEDSTGGSSGSTVDSSDLTTMSSDVTSSSDETTSDSSTPTSEETSPSSESTSETTPFSTETSIFTDTTESSDLTSANTESSDLTSTDTESTYLTTDSSDLTTATSDITTVTSDFTGTTEEKEIVPENIGESDFGAEPNGLSTDADASEGTGSTDSIATDSTVTGDSDATSDITTEIDMTGTTESGPTEDTSMTGSTEEDITSSTDETMTTESGMTSEFTTSSDMSTESPMSTDSDATDETSSTDTTLFDIWSSTTESSFSTDESSDFSSWGTTPYTIESITRKKSRKCVRRKTPACKSTPFGCCYDLITPAKGPFDQGCPTPKTCNDTKHGCCKDGVSPATGPKFIGCPKTDCKDSLFGCCPDGTTPSEGNNNEGCVPEPKCVKSKFGCCPDNSTAATGPNDKGCKECERSKFGCCPDGTTSAKGKKDKGCPKIDCSNTTFGCCPDGQNAADGEHFKGCDIINKDNCTASYYGCCPDGSSAALGPEYQGCRMACEDEQHGCCPDRVTAAHGPNQEGCCLAHTHGCCPDNIIPARGPNLEGCGCQYSPYGCCPDNSTAARGHGNDGCGCEHTEHGCCPDRYTPAAGPENQGCSCHTFQFGCCPDGISVAKGPHQQGCGCRNTEFGCCSDEQTPAQGADKYGCDCSSSKYGCCPDGRTDSEGENFEGCENVPQNQQEVCSIEKQRGDCSNYTVKWYYDFEYGGCSRFWYSGCGGTTNRFTSMEDCKSICIEPQGKDICQLPKVPGACEGYYPSWYYDKERKQCAQFIWGGCLGNANRFETRDDCQALCHVDKDQDACEQPREEGPCRGSYRRWYFNKESNSCEQFAYGGCKGNNNNFPAEMACKQQCLQPGRKKDVCALPRAQGSCSQREARWYFDASENRCMPFYYSGCEGNNNRFTSRETCEADCPTAVERDTCILPALAGECHNYVERWYYNTNEKRCRPFYYGGCGGNDNNFVNQDACLQRCEQQQTTPAPQQTEFRREDCFLSNDTGPCRSSMARWFYDSRDGVCKQFLYGGCQGNKNNFESKEECHHRCGTVQDVCELPMVVGPCNSDYLQWFYDRQTDTCQEFNYGGCQGNDNRFSDQESCDRRCRKSEVPVTYAPPFQHVQTHAPVEDAHRPESEAHICYSPVDVGNCSDNQPSWFYDAASQKCQAFVYTGCGGNANRFVSDEQCQRHCGRFRGLNVCSHPKDTGDCQDAIIKWYYDHESRRCQQFYYGGCEGSGNRFSTVEECESVCVQLVEPAPKNETSESHAAVCLLPVEVGPCEGQYHQMRWHFDEERRNCISFIYSGCGGNHNNFKSYQNCMDFCRTELGQHGPPNEIDVDQTRPKDTCDAYRDECTSLLCPFGTEGYVDVEMCNRCRCYEPCRDTQCPENTICTIDLNPNASMPHQTQFIAACRPTYKEGACPQISGEHDCSTECRTDADCSGELKCCPTNCGAMCVIPYSPEQYNTDSPAYTEGPIISGGQPPVIIDPHSDTEVSAEEGSYALMRCNAQGNPPPTITWRKDNEIIDGSKPRQRILNDGSMQLVGLDKGDAGIYSCVAENGIGHPARKDVRLEVSDPTPHPANVVGEDDTRITVTLGVPYHLRCFAFGWPRPTVTWWRGDSMLPFSSESFEQKRDYTLLIRSVHLQNLGIYTCQAYNGLGKAASFSITIQSLGPVHTTDPEDEQYKKYLISAPDKPTTPRPVWPFRPTRRPTPPRRPHPTPQAYHPAPYTDPNPEIVPDVQQPQVYTVPVRTNITINRNVFAVDSDISIPCVVDGHPVPRVQWYKNSVPIEQSERVQISESHRLSIQRANVDDSGEYLCEAENQYSKSSSSVKISVEGVYIHPNCTDNPFFAKCVLIVQANYCTHKYYARFCCKSCTQAGQLPSYGPHLVTDSRQGHPEQGSNYIN